MADRILSQYEIDSVLRNVHQETEDSAKKAQPYDFRRPERIAKDQLQTIRLIHENFARSVGLSLSAFLRSQIVANFVSVEQLSFADFARSLPGPSCLLALGVHPYEENSVLQLDRALAFLILEILLGGAGKTIAKIERDITEIERGVLDSPFRIILQDLRSAWLSVAPVDFFVQSHVSEPQLLQVLAQDDAVVVVSMELRVKENSGLMHLAFPSTLIKMFRERSGQLTTMRHREPSETDHARILHRLKPANVELEAKLAGPRLRLESLMRMEVGDVLALDHALTKELELRLNGKTKFLGRVVNSGNRLGFQITGLP